MRAVFGVRRFPLTIVSRSGLEICDQRSGKGYDAARGQRAIDWGKGYRGRNQRQRLAKKRITILSKRVLHPLFTDEKVGEVFHAMIDWVIEGRR